MSADPDQLVTCEANRACAEQILDALLAKISRRPLSDEERDALLALYDHEDNSGHAESLELMVTGAILSPSFAYRFELGGEIDAEHASQLSSIEIADLLAFALTSAPPDEALKNAAAEDTLRDPDVREAHARRLLPQMGPQLERFAVEWLGISDLRNETKDPVRYPSFDDALKSEMELETRTFVRETLLSGGSLSDLFSSSSSYAGPSLAEHYGASHEGDGLQPITLNPEERRGVLTHASFMTTHANAAESAPIRRGVFIWRHLLCNPLPNPPPDIEVSPVEASETMTARDALAEHSRNPSCAECHQVIDPLGLGLEDYDAIGTFRVDSRVDLSGEVFGTGATFSGGTGLAAWLAESDRASACFVENVAHFLMGAEVGEVERNAWIDEVRLGFEDTGRFEELVVALVRSDGFITRTSERSAGGEE